MTAADTRTLNLETHSRFCGVVTGESGGMSLTLVVSPKLWSTHWREHRARDDDAFYQRPVEVTWSAQESRKLIFLHEVETCRLHLPPGDDLNARQAAVNALLETSTAEAGVLADHRGRAHINAFELVSHAAHTALKGRPYHPPDEGRGRLYALMLLHGHVPIDPRDELGHLARDPMLTPLVHHLFVEAVEKNRRHIRQGYVRREETLRTVRGRVVASSLARQLVSGAPELLCRYEEFTHETPLFRIIGTALDVVAGGTWLDDRGDSSARAQGIKLRRYLSSIPSLPSRAMALSQASRLCLGPLLRRWERPLRLARMVLEATVPKARHDTRTITPGIWTLDTATLWERLLAESLKRLGEPVTEQGEADAPFAHVGGRRSMDLVSGSRVLDAKYKYPSGSPSTADVNQMYVYGHVRRARTSDVGLIYPSPRGEAEVHCGAGSHREGEGKSAGDVRGPRAPELKLAQRVQQALLRLQELEVDTGAELADLATEVETWLEPLRFHCWSMPFPSLDDVRSIDAWERYEQRLDQALGESLKSEDI